MGQCFLTIDTMKIFVFLSLLSLVYSPASCFLPLRPLRRHQLRRLAQGCRRSGWCEGGSDLPLPPGGWLQGWLCQQCGLRGALPPLTTSTSPLPHHGIISDRRDSVTLGTTSTTTGRP